MPGKTMQQVIVPSPDSLRNCQTAHSALCASKSAPGGGVIVGPAVCVHLLKTVNYV